VALPPDAPPACAAAFRDQESELEALPDPELTRPDKHGSSAVHWAAGGNSVAALRHLLGVRRRAGVGVERREAKKGGGRGGSGGSGRTPLHFAARNGCLEAVRCLCEEFGASPDPAAKAGVTPFQMAVWQNHLEVAKYLVEERGVDPKQVNAFECGAQHWLGNCPRDRADVSPLEDTGSGLLPLARWLRSVQGGLDFELKQRNGHTPLHKAAWGGHLALVKFICRELEVDDASVDDGGNYAADIADSAGAFEVSAWLRRNASPAVSGALRTLGIARSPWACPSDRVRLLRAAYLAKCRSLHPDAVARQTLGGRPQAPSGEGGSGGEGEGEVPSPDSKRVGPGEGRREEGGIENPDVLEGEAVGGEEVGRRGGEESADDFAAVSRAHSLLASWLEAEAGGGEALVNRAREARQAPEAQDRWAQRNPRRLLPRLIAAAASAEAAEAAEASGASAVPWAPRGACVAAARRDFALKLAATVLEYGLSRGLPLASLPRRFKAVWGVDLPSAEDLGLKPGLPLARMLTEYFASTVRIERAAAAPLTRPQGSDGSGDRGDSAGGRGQGGSGRHDGGGVLTLHVVNPALRGVAEAGADPRSNGTGSR